MSFLNIFHLLALLLAPILGLLVYVTNRARASNLFFLIFSIIMAAWLGFLGAAFYLSDESWIARCIRGACMVSVFAAFSFNGLRMALLNPELSPLRIVRTTWPFLAATMFAATICTTRFFLRNVTWSPDLDIAEPHYGPGIAIYGAFHVVALSYLTLRFIQNVRTSVGIVRTELQFVMLGSAVGIGFAMLTTVILPVVTDNTIWVRFAPLAAAALEGITAYGIATRRILEVAGFVRRATAYALLTAYLVLMYLATFFTSRFLLEGLIQNYDLVAQVLAALAAALSLAPANGWMQRFANRLFMNMRTVDPSDIMQKANRILTSVAARDEMLRQFADLITNAFGTDRALIALNEDGTWQMRYPRGTILPMPLSERHALVECLTQGQTLVTDMLNRVRSGPMEYEALTSLSAVHASIAIGIHTPTGLRGIIFMGSRLSGRIYDWEDQRTLQLLANQLAVGLENTELYARLQDSAIYNDILLDNLVSGVIAAGHDQRITICNREAKRILGVEHGNVLQQPIDLLPAPFAQAFRQAFATGQGQRDVDLLLHTARHEAIPVRVGSAMFRSHTGKALGVLLVFNDLTALRKLEGQVRRTDRLASLGTLSAGMAHEIKNPLVTLKTFTQLLPERYEDPDFRTTFSNLVGEEVKRIDSIVNQLLRFARPAKPSLTPTHIHDVVDNTLRLVQQQLKQKNIQLIKEYQVTHDLIRGDGNLLVQAFLNFFLNAVDAMEAGGRLWVGTALVEQETNQPTFLEVPCTETRLRLSIRDSGKGIRADDLPHVFDPFFTTKSSGTGLGLSVSHGIIQEHQAVIDVESTEGEGTVFHVTFPVLQSEVVA
jgi:signal transduction histidine kinase